MLLVLKESHIPIFVDGEVPDSSACEILESASGDDTGILKLIDLRHVLRFSISAFSEKQSQMYNRSACR